MRDALAEGDAVDRCPTLYGPLRSSAKGFPAVRAEDGLPRDMPEAAPNLSRARYPSAPDFFWPACQVARPDRHNPREEEGSACGEVVSGSAATAAAPDGWGRTGRTGSPGVGRHG